MVDYRSNIVVHIHWLSREEGGRASPPEGIFYAANLRFVGFEGLWSVVLNTKETRPNDKGDQDLDIGFFVPDMVRKYLSVGQKLVILEGPARIVANGEILSVIN